MSRIGSTFAAARRGIALTREASAAEPVLRQAIELARSDASDEQASSELAAIVQTHPDAARAAMKVTEKSIDPVMDRAYRLVSATLEARPVQPIDPAKEPNVREFERWSRISIADAFQSLDSLVPGLIKVGAAAEAWGSAHPDATPAERALKSLKLSRKVNRLVAKTRKRDELVVRCGLARSIALTYIDIALGDRERGDASRAFAEISATPRSVTLTTRLPD